MFLGDSYVFFCWSFRDDYHLLKFFFWGVIGPMTIWCHLTDEALGEGAQTK